MSLRTPLGRVLGLGSAKEGTAHWWSQRLSAVALVPLTLWFAVSILGLAAGGALEHAAVVAWIAHPVNTVALVLFVVTLLYHSQLGFQVVIEDYVHVEWLKIAALVGQKFLHVVLAVAGAFAVLRAAMGG